MNTAPVLVSERPQPDPTGIRGTNQSGMRALNERLILSLIRTRGALAKSDIARMTGLSAQTMSVIMRGLETEGLILRGDPVRGRIGQPSVPMSLNPEGAFFFGLKIGRRSADLTLIDFLGKVRATERQLYRWPTPGAVVEFVRDAVPAITSRLPPDVSERIGGMGVAMPFQLWNWVNAIGAPQTEMDEWRHRDIAAELSEMTGMQVTVQNDATAACGAELVFGTGERAKDFLYFYFGYFIGGGLVLNNQLFTGRTGNAAGVGPMPVPGPDGNMHRLFDVASMSVLADAMEARGEPSSHLFVMPDEWVVSDAVLSGWIASASKGLASAILSSTALVELEAVVIDGWMPARVRAEITRQTRDAFLKLDLAGIDPPDIREGTVGPHARALGAAAIPLSQRYLIESPAA